MLHGVLRCLSVGGVFHNLVLQEARIELLTKLQYFIAAFTGCCHKSSKAMLGCSCSSLNCICIGCYSFVLITGDSFQKWLKRYFNLTPNLISAFQTGICCRSLTLYGYGLQLVVSQPTASLSKRKVEWLISSVQNIPLNGPCCRKQVFEFCINYYFF